MLENEGAEDKLKYMGGRFDHFHTMIECITITSLI